MSRRGGRKGAAAVVPPKILSKSSSQPVLVPAVVTLATRGPPAGAALSAKAGAGPPLPAPQQGPASRSATPTAPAPARSPGGSPGGAGKNAGSPSEEGRRRERGHRRGGRGLGGGALPSNQVEKVAGRFGLMNARMDLTVDAMSRHLHDQAGFVVIGVLGLEGVGKSAILGELAKFLNPGGAPEDVFPVETLDQQARCQHATSGITAYVTLDRYILLDVQPVFSSSILSNMLQNPDKLSPTKEAPTPEALYELQSLQLTLFLLNACHVLLVVQDGVVDVNLLRFLRTVEMLGTRVPDVSSATAVHNSKDQDGMMVSGLSLKSAADVVFVFNRLAEEECGRPQVSQLGQVLNSHFRGAGFRKNGKVVPRGYDGADPGGDQVNFFLVPNRDLDGARTTDGYSAAVRELCTKILEMPKRRFAQPMTEAEWLRGAMSLWQLVRGSAAIGEYVKMLQVRHHLV